MIDENTRDKYATAAANQHCRCWTDDYRPNRKGGHTHNIIKNMELRLMLSKKEIRSLRKIMKREKKDR